MKSLHIGQRRGGNELGCAYCNNRVETAAPGWSLAVPGSLTAPKGNGAGQISKRPSPCGVGGRFSGSLTMQLADFALKKFDGQLSWTQ